MEDKVKSQFDKVQGVLTKLTKLDDKKNQLISSKTLEENTLKTEQQTVSDDFDVEKAKQLQILHYEQIIRKTLELFNINYDDMIRMDGESAYYKAVSFYPHLLDEVKKSVCPPLTAIQIAKSMQPYMEFTAKYGTSIQDIKQALKQEVRNEEMAAKSAKVKVTQPQAKPVQQTSVFSDIGNAITQNTKAQPEKQDDSLASFFVR